MGKVTLQTQAKVVDVNGEKKKVRFLDNESFDKFNYAVLGLENISLPSIQVEAIASVFDLAGFTSFCNKRDSHLSIPGYLNDFLNWLFEEIKKELVADSCEEGKELYCDLPFLAKFLGDGVLFLWDTKNMSGIGICNVVVLCREACQNYSRYFYPKINKEVVEPPRALRCGIARGTVCSVGNGEDYVGPCINIAARLQKLSDLTFSFHRKGFNIQKDMDEPTRAFFVLKRVSIRDVGENELVYLLKNEFHNLPEDEKKIFREP